MNPPRGRFITFEGIDGAGKSTHVDWLAKRLREQGHTVVVTREPGGTGLGEGLRAILLATVMDPETEALLMFAARAENLRQVIRPALAAGSWVISDRFTDATFAYQGAGKGIPPERLHILEQWVHADLQPDLTFLFDVDVTTAQTRLQNAREPDKFERENAAFFERVRNGYRQRAQEAPSRIRIIGGDQAIETIRKQLEDYIITI